MKTLVYKRFCSFLFLYNSLVQNAFSIAHSPQHNQLTNLLEGIYEAGDEVVICAAVSDEPRVCRVLRVVLMLCMGKEKKKVIRTLEGIHTRPTSAYKFLNPSLGFHIFSNNIMIADFIHFFCTLALVRKS